MSMLAWDESGDQLEEQRLRPVGKAPTGFSAAAAKKQHIQRNTADRAYGGNDGDARGEKEVPIEIQPHSYDKIVIKDYMGSDGPWFCYAWVDKKK
eukprot:CAMPEP_0183429192 /NCGR_PEP_ID=MMETSP0370-20130417/48224_1 /TAXON_ID=268820 /ORGANISM="Peridinium aciculiferum, Strain PAER-2" /LENGTH=94 /DNA_ID=CAMNT_0025614161 /DNA_START=45 /DNA_END=329 /DNA_ORIENTATION=+